MLAREAHVLRGIAFITNAAKGFAQKLPEEKRHSELLRHLRTRQHR